MKINKKEAGYRPTFNKSCSVTYPGLVQHVRQLVDPVEEDLHLRLKILSVLLRLLNLRLHHLGLLLQLEQVSLQLLLVRLDGHE